MHTKILAVFREFLPSILLFFSFLANNIFSVELSSEVTDILKFFNVFKRLFLVFLLTQIQF